MLFWMGHPSYTPSLLYMSTGVFRDHKSSNRIELYLKLFKTYCIFSDLVPGSGARDLGGWRCGCVWFLPICVHTHTCMYMCMCNAKIYMLRNWKWLLTWWYPCLLCSTCVCLCTCMCISACVCMCVCVWGFPHPPTHPQGGPPHQYKFNKSWTNWGNSILFEDLKSVETP